MAPLVAAAIPWVASAVGTMLPAIVNSFRSGKSPEEAQAEIAPQRQALVERLVGSGMTGPAAEAMADEAMADELAKAQLPEEMNPWLSMALSIGGAVGGWKSGKMLGGKLGGAEVSKAAAVDTPAEQALTKPASGQPAAVAPTEAATAMRPQDEIAAKLKAREAYDTKRMSLDDTDPELVKAVDDSWLAGRMERKSPFPVAPDFLPGEMEMRTPGKMLRPWESMPEVGGAIIRKELRKLKADPRGPLASSRSPFPDAPAEDYRSALYRYSGG